MIIDTTYLLPLARIAIDTDLLEAIAKGRASLKFEEIAINAISIFELQAKAARLLVPAEFVIKAVEVIINSFKTIPFYRNDIIELSYQLRTIISDYLDCVIVATAVAEKENLVTEDSLILAQADKLEKEYGIKVMSHKEVVR
ncbi:MAG: PIN domain-containing protein [Nitrososphaerota archaeon]